MGVLMAGWYSVLLSMILVLPAFAQEYGNYGARLGTIKRGGRVSFEPAGPGVLFDALDPALRKWYVPQELYAEYRWRQGEYSNYARQNYQRYVSTALEGEYWYDVYGNLLTRGWLIYDWRQEAPQPFGSTLQKTRNFSGWFNNLVIGSDHQGQYHYALTVGNQIRTTLTPMTFSKPLFDGLQWDFASDKYTLTFLLSRISETGLISAERPEQWTNNTNLFGGRLVAQVGDFVKVGGTLVNAHHAQTQLEAVNGDLFQGQLTESQNFGNVTAVQLRIRDDSPADGAGGGALFAADILVRDLEGQVHRGSQIGFRPLVEGGFQRRGYLAADGVEQILVTYDFSDRAYTGPDPSEITGIQFELVVANDYLIEVASNRQLDADETQVFLPLAQARGNVQDGSNQQVLLFEYGLPTANNLAGFTVELTDLAGFKGYLEVDLNHRYRQFPNPNLKRHRAASDRSLAWFANLARQVYPYFAFGEVFSVAPEYTTGLVVSDAEGALDYNNPFQRYEFVEDNDDQDRWPDWRRKGWGSGDEEIFPGWDENNDFISDFNQNDNEDSPNLVPDYEEPFLRFYTDRPEFLYGVDMNHNLTIDRFENDQEPDYPYRKDQRGFNLYAGTFLGPRARVMGGLMRSRQFSDQRRNRAAYLVVTVDQDHPRWGRLRLFQDLRRVQDTIRDDLLQWQQRPNTRGGLQLAIDPLPAQDTWVNTTWLGLEERLWTELELAHKLKWQYYRQLDGRLELELRGQRRHGQFLGLINRADYHLRLGRWTLNPRWKSEFLYQAPVQRELPRRRELTELFALVLRVPFMQRSLVETGAEYEVFSQLRQPPPPGADPDYTALTSTLQMTNLTEYLGYRLTTIAGFTVTRLALQYEPAEIRTRGFLTIYAGVER
jgi:hypothetical protein